MTLILSSNAIQRRIKDTAWRGPINWARLNGITLRPYQQEISRAIIDSIINQRGLTFVIVLPRQSGKNELQSHIFAWLMFRYARKGGRIVTVSPTFKPQTVNSMDRVRASLDRNPVTLGNWRGSAGFIYKYQASRLQFFSGEATAKVVGATADLLMSVDEAQDVSASKFDKDFDPMTAATNATRVFWGTVWTKDTLLHRQAEIAKQEEKKDNIRRLFQFNADDVRALVPAYGEHVDRVIAEKGRQHPLVKTQYFCEEIDAQVGMFNAGRLALMQGDQPEQTEPTSGHLYAFCIDVGGMDEALLNLDGMGNPGRDSTTLSIVDIDLSTLATLQSPTYRIVNRLSWQGQSHLNVFGILKSMADTWKPQHIIVDATGVGEGLWAMLDKAFPTRVIPIKFTQQTKSEIGYGYLAIIETGRLHDCCRNNEVRIQYEKCQSEILPGPAHTMRWGVKDGTRGPDGLLVHDDYLLADALTSELDKLEWTIPIQPEMMHVEDPLKNMDRNY
jgi:hypothetical protein